MERKAGFAPTSREAESTYSSVIQLPLDIESLTNEELRAKRRHIRLNPEEVKAIERMTKEGAFGPALRQMQISHETQLEAQRKTIESFDFQWRRLSDGPYLLSDAHWRSNVAEYILDELGGTADWVKGKNVLDAGCGQGRWSYGFEKLGSHIFGFDSSESGIDYARHTIPNGQFTVANLLDHERLLELYAPQQFDVIWCWGVLHHTGNPILAMRNLIPLLASNGLLHVYVYGKKSFRFRLWKFIFSKFNYQERVVISTIISTSLALRCVCLAAVTYCFNKKRPSIWHPKQFVHGIFDVYPILHSCIRHPTQFVHGIFDAYSPQLASEHTEEEVAQWFREIGLIPRRVHPAWVKRSTDIFMTGRKC